MNIKRGLGIALAGALGWGVAALVSLWFSETGAPTAVTLVVGLLALGGLLAVLVGLSVVAWSLVRGKPTEG